MNTFTKAAADKEEEGGDGTASAVGNQSIIKSPKTPEQMAAREGTDESRGEGNETWAEKQK